MKWGIRAIVGESFAEIFFGNCIANGVPCLTASPDDLEALQTALEQDAQTEIRLDLEQLALSYGDQEISLTFNEGARQMLVTGKWDSCGQLIQNIEEIKVTASTLPYLHWNLAVS
jgi:3-isopropylmalate/(R)-2-methylmalate dehydratase small subunit